MVTQNDSGSWVYMLNVAHDGQLYDARSGCYIKLERSQTQFTVRFKSKNTTRRMTSFLCVFREIKNSINNALVNHPLEN